MSLIRTQHRLFDHSPKRHFLGKELAGGASNPGSEPGRVAALGNRLRTLNAINLIILFSAVWAMSVAITATTRTCVLLTEVVSLCATAPAGLFGIPQKGSLLPGHDGDLLIVDPSSHSEMHSGLHMSTDFSPFDGRRLKGRIDTVVSAGNVLVRSGEWAGLPATGRFLRRQSIRGRHYSSM